MSRSCRRTLPGCLKPCRRLGCGWIRMAIRPTARGVPRGRVDTRTSASDEGRMEPWPWQMMVCPICLWMSMSRKRMKRRRSQRRERHRRMWQMMRRRPLRREHRWCQVCRSGCRERPGARLVTRNPPQQEVPAETGPVSGCAGWEAIRSV